MIRKLMAASVALAATLAFSLGCPRQDVTPPSGSPAVSRSVAAAQTASREAPAGDRDLNVGSESDSLVAELPRVDLQKSELALVDHLPIDADGPKVEISEAKKLNPIRLPSSASLNTKPPVAPPDVAIRPADAAVVDVPAHEPATAAKPPENPSAKPVLPVAAADPAEPPHAEGDPAQAPGKAGPALFQNWPRPKAVIIATGLQMGYIEPCGCSGKQNQKGGLSRRHNMLKQLATKGWSLVPVDVGGQVERFGKQSELKFLATCDALKVMKYEAIAFGADDLRLPAESLTAAAVNQQPSPFLSASVALFGFEQNLMPRFRVITAGGLKIGVTAIVGAAIQKDINNGELEFKPAAKALAEVLPQMKAAKCDYLLLLAEVNSTETIALAKQFPEFNFIVTSASAAEPPRQPALISGTKTWLIEVGQKGMYANAIGLFDDAAQPVRFQKITLDASWGESDDMKQVMVSYQEQLKQLGLAALGLTPPRDYPNGHNLKFVGSKECGTCHTKAYAVWAKTPHAKALQTLAKLDPPRNFDPECISCHVTGWDPQRFYPYKGGYTSIEKTPLLAGNGCENCHGPGSAHVDAENGNAKLSDADISALRTSMRIPLARAENNCTQCHDGDNSLNFDFKTYWPKVAHQGKD